MRVIVPGGYYSYDSAGKKIWLDYQYYGTTLENIEKIKNLTRNKILYDCKRSTVLPTVENGCITHSYQGTEADADKIQVTLRTPITNSLTELEAVDGVVTLSTDGKVLVLPTEDAAILPSFNQSVLDSNRLTIAESPFGGLKGSGSPDYAPGTLFCQTDGVYLTDTSGTKSTKTLTAGKLKELNLLTVDTTGHTITEEFIIANTATSNCPTVIDDCSSATGWSILNGSGEITVESGRIKVAGTSDSSGYLTIQKTVTLNLSAYTIFGCLLESNVAGSAYIQIKTGTPYKVWDSATRFTLALNTNTKFFLPLLAPQGTTGQTPSTVSGTFALASTSLIAVGVKIGNSAACTFYVDDITADTAKSAYIELQTPDNLADSSLTLQVHDGSTYQTTGTYKLDSSYAAVGTLSPANWKFADQTQLDDVYGAGSGRALFPKRSSGVTVSGSTGSITYSENKGTKNRIGIRVDLPPSDGGRTDFNKIRLKVILSYTDTVGNIVPDLSGNNNTGTIVGWVTKLNDGGLQFNLGTSSVSIPDSSALRMSAGGTINAWIYPNSLGGGTYGRIIDKSFGPDGENGYIFYLSGANRISFKVNANAPTTTSSNNAITLSQWQYVSVDFDSSGKKLFVNLVDVTSSGGTNTTLPPNVAGIVTIGNRTTLLDRGFDGNIKDITYYNRILTPSEKEAAKNGNPPSSGLIYRGFNSIPVNMGSTTHEFADSTNTSYGLQNLSKPWIALYDPANSLIDFYLFTHRPQNMSFKRDETGTIYSLSLYPGAGAVYHGQIPFADLTLDTNSDTIPDCLEASINGSVTKFLANYSMVI